MNKKIFLTLALSFLSFSAHAINSVNLEAVKPEQIERCQAVKAETLPLIVGEITWDSPDQSIGVTTTKEGSHPVTLNTEIAKTLKDSFNSMFTKCGFKIGTKGQPAIVIDIQVQDFFVKAENALVVGKTEGTSRFILSFNNSKNDTYTSDNYAIEKEYKTGPTKKLSRLEKVINMILVDTMNEIASSRSFYDALAQLSK